MTLPTITALPTPPSRATDTPTEFADNADAFLGALPTFVTELNAYGDDLADSNGVANYSASSTTSVAIGTGSKSFTVETGKRFVAGTFLTIADSAAPTTNYLYGQVTSYNSLTGALVFDSQRVGGSGTKTAWVLSLSGPQGAGGDTLPAFAGNQYKVLAVNAGATDKEWVSTGWKQIATSALSGATGVTFSSIPQIYTDLLVTFENMSTVGTPDLNLSMSYDGVTWLANALIISTLVAAGSYSFDLEVHAYTRIHGLLFHCIRTMTPFITPTGTSAGEWRLSAAGVNHLRLTLSSSTFDAGTATLWGR